MENWKAIYLFLLLKKKISIQIHRGSLEYFFLQWVCFSKVNLEVLPIWLRKSGAPVNAFTAFSVAWKPSPPTDATRSCWCFSRVPLFASLTTEKEDRVMSEVLFVLQDDSFSKSFQPRILVFLCSIHLPLPGSLPQLLLFCSPREGFHYHLLSSSPSNLKITIIIIIKFFLSEISHNCIQFTLGTRLKDRGFEIWSTK